MDTQDQILRGTETGKRIKGNIRADSAGTYLPVGERKGGIGFLAGMIKYLQSFRFKGLTVILGVFLAISVVLWTERSGIQYQAEIKKNAYLDRDTVVTETQAVKNIESSCLVLMDSSQADSVVAWEEFERIFM